MLLNLRRQRIENAENYLTAHGGIVIAMSGSSSLLFSLGQFSLGFFPCSSPTSNANENRAPTNPRTLVALSTRRRVSARRVRRSGQIRMGRTTGRARDNMTTLTWTMGHQPKSLTIRMMRRFIVLILYMIYTGACIVPPLVPILDYPSK
jgi:hypothetical protein